MNQQFGIFQGSGMPSPNQYMPSPNRPQAPSAPFVNSSPNYPNPVQMPMPFGSGVNIGFVPPPTQPAFSQNSNYPGTIQSPNSGYPQHSQAPYQTQRGFPQQNYGTQNQTGYSAQNFLNVQSPYPNQQRISNSQAPYPSQTHYSSPQTQSPYPSNQGFSPQSQAPYLSPTQPYSPYPNQMNQKQSTLPPRNLYPNINQVPVPHAFTNQRRYYDNQYTAANQFLRKVRDHLWMAFSY